MSAPAAKVTRVVPLGRALELTLPDGTPDGGFASCVVLLDIDATGLTTMLCEALPPLLQAGASVLVQLQMPREEGGAGRDAALCRLTQRLGSAGYTGMQLYHLFANGQRERTLSCEWGGGHGRGADSD